MARIGKQAADIFSSTTIADADSTERRGAGRPPTHESSWTKISVVMLDRQIVFLDELAIAIRKQSGTVIRRAEIIRALVDAMEESRIDVMSAASEEDLKGILTRHLRKSATKASGE